MKKIVAFLFIMAYGVTSLGAPLVVHRCTNDFFQQDQFGFEHGCCHNQTTDGNCCSGNRHAANHCHVNANDNAVELSFKDFAPQSPMIVLPGETFPVNDVWTEQSTSWNKFSPPLYKIRIHLYNRVLLI